MIGRDTNITNRVVMRPIKVQTVFLVGKRSSVGLLIGANTMQYFGINAQPGLGSSIWGNEKWPTRVAIATSPYSSYIRDWNLEMTDEALYSTIVSNVARLDDTVLAEVDLTAQTKAAAEMKLERPIQGTELYKEGNVVERLLSEAKKDLGTNK